LVTFKTKKGKVLTYRPRQLELFTGRYLKAVRKGDNYAKSEPARFGNWFEAFRPKKINPEDLNMD